MKPSKEFSPHATVLQVAGPHCGSVERHGPDDRHIEPPNCFVRASQVGHDACECTHLSLQPGAQDPKVLRIPPVGIQGQAEIFHRSADPDAGIPDPQGRSVGNTAPNLVREPYRHRFREGDSQTERPYRGDDASQRPLSEVDCCSPSLPGCHHQSVVRLTHQRNVR